MEINKICELCGKQFTTSSNQNFNICEDVHIYKCKYCNKNINVTRSEKDWYTRKAILSKGYAFCSSNCSAKYNNILKFKNKYNNISEDVKNLYENTSINKTLIAKQCNISINILNRIIKLFDLHRSDDLVKQMYSEKSILSNEKLKQSDNYSQYIAKLSAKSKEQWRKYSEKQIAERTSKIQQKLLNKSLDEIKSIASKRRKRRKASDGKLFDSNYEVLVYEFCKRNNIPIETQIPMDIKINNISHNIIIDFKIDDIYFECKGGHLLHGIFDNSAIPLADKLNFYRDNHIILITDKEGSDIIPKPNGVHGGSNGLKYLSKCKDPLIGVDIKLFDNPEIPYADDRPKCFYNVRVDNKPSVSEAWTDEHLRWKMIKNRIMYSGGFIDNKQILNAMNITRTCKQPSWFSKSFAKYIIQNFITSDTILDPFAGWGARCDASRELGKYYYGWDFNEDLVKWHHDKGRLFETNYGINFGDANNIKINRDDCSVFICPPYSDPKTGRCFEDYNFDGFNDSAKSLSQCDWLKIVMKNIPNAKEYVMVCKVVDSGFEKFIIDQKLNKSHFGMNKESIIKITQAQKQAYFNF